MKWHVLRPLWVALGLVGTILVARHFLVPDDFGVHGKDFTYGYYRLSNVAEWQAFPVKYVGRDGCAECHEDNVNSVSESPHANIQCENCHGPGTNHPDDLEFLPIDRSREHCLRCHGRLDYPHNARSAIPAVDGQKHKRRRECSKCHDPHDPGED